MKRDEARYLAGSVLYGLHWIGSLTVEEQWLVSEYGGPVPKPTHPDPNVRVLWSIPRPRSPLPPGAQMAEKIGAAVDRRNRMVRQYYKAEEWLADNGFVGDQIDRAKFESKLDDQRLEGQVIDEVLKGRASPSAPQAKQLRSAGQRANKALAALYPAGVPERAELPDKVLAAKVYDWLAKSPRYKDAGRPDTDTILRVAGRRK